MPPKITSLPLPAAIDAAYLLLLGQLCISLSKLAFGAVFVAKTGINFQFSALSTMIWGLSVIVVAILFLNILSSWKSTRATFDELGYYPNSLLTSDVLIIVAFFFINSVAAAPIMFLDSTSLNQATIETYMKNIEKLWSPVVPLLFLTSGLLVLAYRNWNLCYLNELANLDPPKDAKSIEAVKTGLGKFNSLYSFFAILFFLFFLIEIFFERFFMTIGFLIVWIAFWCYINFSWLFDPPTEKAKPNMNAS